MAVIKKKKDKGLPAVNTSALPDIVFMLLFFFMVATVMREVDLKVSVNKPQATEILAYADEVAVDAAPTSVEAQYDAAQQVGGGEKAPELKGESSAAVANSSLIARLLRPTSTVIVTGTSINMSRSISPTAPDGASSSSGGTAVVSSSLIVRAP